MKIRRYAVIASLLLFIIMFCFLSCLCSPGFAQSRGLKIVAVDESTKEWKEISLYNKAYAVIIGIDQYPNLLPDQQLSYAVSDATGVERVLRNKFVFNQIYTLYNEQATKSNIMDVLLNKLSKLSKDDAVFVFYAGHGGQEKTDFGEIGFIVPYDGDFTDMRTVISMATIRDDISKRIRAKHVFYVMDSCYSGILVTKRSAGMKGTRRDIAYLKQIAKEPVRQVLTAGSANQEVLDGGPGGHSVFTGRFLEILDSADDFITATEISSLVKERVFSDANTRGHLQTPKYGELFGLGDFIFMPSMTKKLGSIKQHISELEKELEEIKEAEENAIKYHDEAAKRETERRRKVAEAKLNAKELQEERLERERLLQEKKEQERRKNIAEQKKKQEEESLRLASLQLEITEKRKKYKTSMTLSLSDSIREMQSLDKQINAIKLKFIDELKQRILSIARDYSDNFQNVILAKDEFETEEEYQARLAKQVKSKQSNNQVKFGLAIDTIETAYKGQIAPLIQQMKEISNNKYTVYGHDALVIKLGKYNADKESFKITIASKNIKRPIYTQGRFHFVSNMEGQVRRLGIQKGDMLVKYNNIMVTPEVNWSRLRQTVISDTVEMEVERDGKLLQFTLKKGKFGAYIYVDDYAKDLQPNQFIVNSDLYVPRAEARKFKQNYLNGFITAELKVRPITPFMSLVTKAVVVDESNDKRYDMFKSRFVNMGNRLTYDTLEQIYWLTRIHHKKLTWDGATKFTEKLLYKGLKGWRLPTINEFTSLHKTLISKYFNFPKGEFHTRTSNENKDNDKQHNFVINKTYTESKGQRELFVYVLPSQYSLNHYDIFSSRFIELDNSLLFDSENKIIWKSKNMQRKMTWLEANKFLSDFNHQGVKGWRLPTIDEFKSLYDDTIPGLNENFNFPKGEFHTKSKSGEKNMQYNPRKHKSYNESINQREWIVCVM